ncbi:MAG TPA: hypothetical protein VGK93_03730 [Candidatus Eisenbacteria bacterium]|jgi:hypothetical protein
MRATRVIGCTIAALAIAGMASAATIRKGSSILAIQLNEGKADLSDGNIFAFANTEMGVQAQFWHFMTDEYAFNVSAGIGYYREAQKGDPSVLNPITGEPDFRDDIYTQDSWQFRVGGDRWGRINDRFHVFAGPGIQVWGGKFKVERSSGDFESPSTTRYGLSGRLGVLLHLGESFGMVGQLGHYWAYATVKNGPATLKWTPSGRDGALGVTFHF